LSALALLALAVVGLLSGFLAGLIGIGGGVLIVPFLYFFYGHPAWSGFALPADMHVAVAHATSLLVIVPTAIRGTFTYARADLIVWRVAIPVAVASIVGGIIGARVAIFAPGELLKVLFGGFLIAVSIQLLMQRRERPVREPVAIPWRVALTGLLIGALSGMMGVGGGLLALPLLMNLLHVDLKRAAATSLAIVSVSAASGVVTYAVSGLAHESLPAGSLGYVHVLAALPIAAGAIISVPWGARANQRLDVRVLRYIFSAVFFMFGLRLIAMNATVLF
jgi:uncharacterized membrane protein YfcA